MKYLFQLLVFTGFCMSCSEQQKPQIIASKSNNSLAWIDTIRFNSKLTGEQRKQVYFARNNEENYKSLTDTNRVMLRFYWYRSFHPYVVVRLENRPEVYDSSGVRKIYTEWFALYKEDIPRLNGDCPVRINDKCTGKPYPFVHQEHVELLKVNYTPVILNALDSIGFWKMKPLYEAGPHTDGSNWTLEVYCKGKYKQVSTNQEQNPIKVICLKMLKMSGYSVKPDEIY